jgi:hypothetical protein
VLTVATGTLASGNVVSLQTLADGNFITVDELVGTPGFDIIADFVAVGSGIQRAQCHVHYDGTAGHIVKLQWFNYFTAAWDDLTGISNTADFEFIEIPLTDVAHHQNAGAMRMRINHTSAGIPTHHLFVDYMAFVKMGFGSSNDHGALLGLADDDHLQYALSGTQAYTVTNVTTDRAYDANATTLDELADVVGTLIADLRAQRIVA